MPTHLYNAKKYPKGRTLWGEKEAVFRPLCAKDSKDFRLRGEENNFTSMDHNVDCNDCLDILIPKHEALLSDLKARRGKLL